MIRYKVFNNLYGDVLSEQREDLEAFVDGVEDPAWLEARPPMTGNEVVFLGGWGSIETARSIMNRVTEDQHPDWSAIPGPIELSLAYLPPDDLYNMYGQFSAIIEEPEWRKLVDAYTADDAQDVRQFIKDIVDPARELPEPDRTGTLQRRYPGTFMNGLLSDPSAPEGQAWVLGEALENPDGVNSTMAELGGRRYGSTLFRASAYNMLNAVEAEEDGEKAIYTLPGVSSGKWTSITVDGQDSLEIRAHDIEDSWTDPVSAERGTSPSVSSRSRVSGQQGNRDSSRDNTVPSEYSGGDESFWHIDSVEGLIEAYGYNHAPLVAAFSDVHGDMAALEALLTGPGQTGQLPPMVQNDEGQIQWYTDQSGSPTRSYVLVVAGDFLNHGDQSREVWETLMRLQEQAPAGHVQLLLGNHEATAYTPSYWADREQLPEDWKGLADALSGQYTLNMDADEQETLFRLGSTGRMKAMFHGYEQTFVHAGIPTMSASDVEAYISTANERLAETSSRLLDGTISTQEILADPGDDIKVFYPGDVPWDDTTAPETGAGMVWMHYNEAIQRAGSDTAAQTGGHTRTPDLAYPNPQQNGPMTDMNTVRDHADGVIDEIALYVEPFGETPFYLGISAEGIAARPIPSY